MSIRAGPEPLVAIAVHNGNYLERRVWPYSTNRCEQHAHQFLCSALSEVVPFGARFNDLRNPMRSTQRIGRTMDRLLFTHRFLRIAPPKIQTSFAHVGIFFRTPCGRFRDLAGMAQKTIHSTEAEVRPVINARCDVCRAVLSPRRTGAVSHVYNSFEPHKRR